MATIPLAALLLRGSDWFDVALRARLEADGWPALSRSQALVFAALDPDRGTRIVDVAASLDVTRQSAHTLVHGLVDLGLLVLVPDPDDGRARRVLPTDRGRRLTTAAARHLADVEAVLSQRIGASAVTALRGAAQADWGPPPT